MVAVSNPALDDLPSVLTDWFDIRSGADTGCSFEISSGVEALNAEGTAWVARGPWSPLGAIEQEALKRAQRAHWSRGLSLTALDGALLASAHANLIDRLAVTKGGENEELGAAIADFRQSFLAALASRGFQLGTEGPADLIVNPPDVASTAYDYANDKMIGLHIDNHESLPLDGRDRALILAHMNIGWCDRFLHVIPTPLLALIRALELDPACGMAPREIKDELFRRWSDAPVLRIRIPPGTAYLLNTQNAIHDGSTSPGEVPDVAFLMMGRPT